jgi:excinuclease UvrABC ATPase subunit
MLYELKRQGNTVVVCENNPGFIRYSDYVIELGLEAGNEGGMLIYEGDVKNLLTSEKSIVAPYLSPEYSFKRQLLEPDFKNTISIKKAFANNLKNINIEIPTRSLVVISGVSGSGKSSLMNEVIYESYFSGTATNCSEINGFEHFNQVFLVEQNIPKCKSKNSIAEYLGLLDAVTNASSPIDLPLSEWLTINNIGKHEELRVLISMFLLDYLIAGQKLKSLNHGEMQRVILVKTLLENQNSPTLFLFDEPTAGLHMQDVEKLLTALDYLMEKGHTIIAIEHHKTVIENADYLIELGPGAGDEGGQVV